MDIAVFRPSTGDWHILASTSGYYAFHWGVATDIPVAGDYDGDGKTDPAVYRPTDGTWYAAKSSTGYATYFQQIWGNYGDQPAPADYDGDGKTDYCIWRPTNGDWWTLKSTGGNTVQTLGVPGDTAIPSAYIKQIGGSVSGYEMATARLSPKNATGGTNLYSRNFGWGTSLVGLPGRAGMNAGFGMGYNSLVWAKIGSTISFDPDTSNISPGFRFGFPVIEPIYYDSDKSKWAYMMVTPDGGRVEFRQTAASGIYETADSSYTQLVRNSSQDPNHPVEEVSMTVTGTDGTQMTFEWKTGAYRCTRVMDRNGNYITIAYDSTGRLTTVTDTLARVFTVNYTDGSPSSITQTWKDGNGAGPNNPTHFWASFTYTTKTVATSFDSSLSVFGPPNGTVIKVLDTVTYADGSYTKFIHNGYIQVEKIENYAADNHKLNHVRTNLDSISGAQGDCPRFTETRTMAENFNMSGGTPQEVVVTNSIPAGSSFSGPNGSESTMVVKVAMASHPDNLYARIHFGPSGYKEGLTLATEDCTGTDSACATHKRWTWTDYTQDSISASYITNPRVRETRVGDGTNTRKTTVSYYEPTTGSFPYGLPETVQVYDSNLSTVKKKSVTTYNLSSTYTNRRIIGLPSMTEAWGWNDSTSSLEYVSKVTYAYDEGTLTGTDPVQNISPDVGHDNSAYGSSFVTGRALLTSITRYDVLSQSSAVTSSVKYNTAGAPVSQTDPLSRTVKIAYTDNFNSTGNPTTYAYPTTLTDPAGNSSTVKYRYDIGANVEATSPAPAGQSYGKTTKRIFDDKGRLERNSVFVSTAEQAYTRYAYPSNGVQSQIFTTVVDTDGGGPGTADEVLTESWTDGAGRVTLTRKPHTFSGGSTVTWAGTETVYDILGRVTMQSVPTEVNSSWQATGDDATRGWIYNRQYYDWKNRVIRTRPSDSTSDTDGKDTLITYEGCGCAGGQITTVKGPVTTAVDVAGVTQTTKRRTQKAYEDILGRTFKTEIWDLDGGGTYAPYSTVKSWFNGRDQAVQIREYSVGDTSGTYQDTTATFDGHGRLKTKHIPQQEPDKSTSYNYNADDSISTVTDARGAMTNYTYGNSYAAERRALLMGISYTVPSGSGITDPPDVTFYYDNAGNRSQMNDALGTVNYGYDELSRLTSESRAYNATDTGFPNNAVTLTYTYTLSGQLKSYATPFSGNLQVSQVNYGFDKVGRLNGVTGTSGGVNTTYANNPHYRAWGALSHLDYGNGTEMNAGGFNNKLQATTFNVKKGTTQIINKAYEFNGDGSMKKETDSVNAKFDRSYEYDFGSRLTKALTGAEARGSTDSYTNIPYHNTYGYDAFNHRTSLNIANFTAPNSTPMTMTYTNNRITSGYASYDSDGNPTTVPGDGKTFSYNAAGQMSHTYIFLCCDGGNYAQQTEDVIYDGDGKVGKVVTADWHNEETPIPDATYKVRSTPLGGQVIYEGAVGSVFAGGTRIWAGGYWTHQDPNGHTIRSTFTDGNVQGDGSLPDAYWDKKELDPDGKQTGFSVPIYYPLDDNDLFAPMMSDFFGSRMVNGQYTSYRVDGINVPADFFVMRLGLGRDPANLAMDLLFFSAAMSRRVTIFDPMGIRPLSGPMDPDDVPWDEAFRHEWQVLPSYPNWSAINLISVQTQQQTPPTKKKQEKSSTFNNIKLSTAINFCSQQMFGVELVGGQWSGPGSDGTMNFQVMNGGTVPVIEDGVQTGSVNTFAIGNATNRSMKELGGNFGMTIDQVGPYGTVHGLISSHTTRFGIRNFRDETNTNWTASDAMTTNLRPVGEAIGIGGQGINRFIWSQIHEGGNSLAQITGHRWEGSIPVGDPDSGWAFQTCVSKNYRSLLAGGKMKLTY